MVGRDIVLNGNSVPGYNYIVNRNLRRGSEAGTWPPIRRLAFPGLCAKAVLILAVAWFFLAEYALAFLQDQELVGIDVFEGFEQAQGPADFD